MADCLHENVYIKNSGDGYCRDCGKMFDDIKHLATKCKHERLTNGDNGIQYCSSCGEEMNMLDFTQEWRWFGPLDNRSKKDISRCHSFQTLPVGLRAVFNVHKIDIPQALINIVESKFQSVLAHNKSKILRNNGRNAIIAACLFFAYQEMHSIAPGPLGVIHYREVRPAEYIGNMFGLTQKEMSSGLSKYYAAFPQDRTKYITIADLIPWVMKSAGIDFKHYHNIIELSNYFSYSSRVIIRSNPQSTAAAIVYFYAQLFPYNKELTFKNAEFADKVQLSEMTISKIVAEMKKIGRIEN